MQLPRAAIAGALVLALAAGAPAGAVDWQAWADERVVRITTTNEDGSEKETKIWLVVVEGQGYVRTGATRWGKNVRRSPDVRLRVGDASHDLRIEFVEDESTRARVIAAFREKYGWEDRLISPFRGRSPSIMRLRPRPTAP